MDSWPSFACSFLIVKLFHFLQYRMFVESASDCMTRWTRHLNDWPTWIKENCVQHLFRTFGSLGNTWAFWIISLPLLIMSPSLWLKHVHPGFITCKQVRNNPTITAFVCFQKFPGTFKTLCLLLLSEQLRYPPSANISQVQTLFQNCQHTAFWYASTTSYIFYRQSRILFDHNLYSSDVSLVTEVLGLPGRVSSSIENFPALKALTHLKTVRIEIVWGPYTTQFFRFLLWIYIKPNAAFNIATNFSLLVHVPM